MKNNLLLLFILAGLNFYSQSKVFKTDIKAYTQVEVLNKKTLKYDQPVQRNNEVTIDYTNNKIEAVDTTNGLMNTYIIKNYKKTATGNLFNCNDMTSKMDCTVETSVVGKRQIFEVCFKNGFKLRFSTP